MFLGRERGNGRGGCWALARYVEPDSIVTLPILTFVFFYFAFVRFDEDGISRDR